MYVVSSLPWTVIALRGLGLVLSELLCYLQQSVDTGPG
jgi:hypothetical protein